MTAAGEHARRRFRTLGAMKKLLILVVLAALATVVAKKVKTV